MTHYQVVIMGGGMAGLAVAERLLKDCPGLDIAVIEPLEYHDFQRLWTMVGAGVMPPERARRDKVELMPAEVTWIRHAVAALFPGYNSVATSEGENISYDYLVIASGMRVNWGGVIGLPEALGKDGVCSVYSHEGAAATWEFIRTFRKGNALFTHPLGSIKCWSGSQQICYLADEHFRREGIRDQTRLVFLSAAPYLFPVKEYREILDQTAAEKGVELHLNTELTEIRPASKEAIFRQLNGGDEITLPYDLLHVAPPMGPLEVFATSELAGEDGWVEVDRHTLQHVRFPNVFGIGDGANLPTMKSGAAAVNQAPIVVSNLIALIEGQPMTAKYDGFSACPIVTSYSQLVMTEFDYNLTPAAGASTELLDLAPRSRHSAAEKGSIDLSEPS